MESREVTIEQKRKFNSFLTSEEGQEFLEILKGMYEDHISSAQVMYMKVLNPNEQIAVQINQATGVKEVIDFCETTMREIKEIKKEEEEPSEN